MMNDKKIVSAFLVLALAMLTQPNFSAAAPKIQYIAPATFTQGMTLREQEEFSALPTAMQSSIMKQIDEGKMPSEKTLDSLSPELREEIIEEVQRRIEEKNGITTPEKTGGETFLSEYWVQFLALVVSLVGVALAVSGFSVASAKKRKSISKFLNEIDDTFAAFKWKSKRCEAELYRLQDLVEDQLKAGKIDEGSFQLLEKRIDKYLSEIKELEDPVSRHEKKKALKKIREEEA